MHYWFGQGNISFKIKHTIKKYSETTLFGVECDCDPHVNSINDNANSSSTVLERKHAQSLT